MSHLVLEMRVTDTKPCFGDLSDSLNSNFRFISGKTLLTWLTKYLFYEPNQCLLKGKVATYF